MTGCGVQVKVTCPACGHVRLPVEEIRAVAGQPHARTHPGGYYVFRCPRCDRRVRRPADVSVLGALTDHGATIVRALGGPGPSGG